MMKKLLITALVIVMGAAGLYAREAGQSSIGGRLGAAFGFHSYADTKGGLADEMSIPANLFIHSDRMNFNFALYGNYAVTDRLSVQTELNFMINQGYELSLLGIGMDITYSSVDIPILLKANFLSTPSYAFGILAGPHISLPLGRASISGGGVSEEFDIDTSATFGLTTGIFSAVQAGPGRFVADLRFVFDFNAVEDMEGLAFMRRRALPITIGYEISF